uniref:3'(2'),5'-bisphosphate nucleotidase 1 n=1 Tax=Aureoumbra lagunensis TaxID=44058 RepID=A0A7S3JVQ6_9STRA|mmetsp:Transcript_17144/g.22256  ORF Transcript_17144/g.22256 Transcript_17144/m.22256 type:complete len:336 (-) Transcript_17144:340-1347(-)|eukprot:CAMPEP_0197288398 /NCGR_PEP_ID=MMETSP0890-20130614/5459_1 /TAXON_ID=44058 ORGANISM="Aureoumbra lagunensis, Strain CCMP1510" /NCGR_SAMPLE_ID=MMETSP0890 /ASSEMBLY_ACC=CAM_ASM_000533 /LENGTH=335 /DNA_ID=CAMNT_0042759085 /DNA_START=119 /DNA_END=1126 /DNA_ORIENTATION=+
MKADASTFGKFSVEGVDIVIDDVAEIAKEAGKAIMEIYNKTPLSEWKKIADFKADGSPLTAADKKANEIICTALEKKFPSIPIMSEETVMASYEERKTWKVYWCVDPLDGTKEFIKRNGQFTVNIGLVQDGKPIAGVVHVPAAEDGPITYKGVKGLGPPVRETDDPLGYDSYKSIFAAAFSESDEKLKIVASASHNTPETDAFIKKYKNPILTSKGSSLKLLMVAEGAAHIYPRCAPTSEWDTCAAHAIVECAGGEVLQLSTSGQPSGPLIYNKENTLNPFFVVYGKRQAPSSKLSKPKKDVVPDASESGILSLKFVLGLGFLSIIAVAIGTMFS